MNAKNQHYNKGTIGTVKKLQNKKFKKLIINFIFIFIFFLLHLYLYLILHLYLYFFFSIFYDFLFGEIIKMLLIVHVLLRIICIYEIKDDILLQY